MTIVSMLLGIFTGELRAAELMTGPMIGHTPTTSADTWFECGRS